MALFLAIIAVSTITASTLITVMLVRAQPDFTISAAPNGVNVQPGGPCGLKTITVTSINGFSGSVTLTSTTSPPSPGVTETFATNPVIVTPSLPGITTKSICASATALPGCQTETITGTSITTSHSVSEIDCVVLPVPQFAYTAKWICNVKQPGLPFNPSAAESIGLVPGEYKTDINVHNPSLTLQTFDLKKKIVLSVREGPVVNVTDVAFLTTHLLPDGAFFMDCREIMKALNLPINTPAKGFVEIITTTPDLNVVAEYSSESFDPSGTFSSGISLEVVSIPSAPFVP